MSELEKYCERTITKLDVVKTEHDLICRILDYFDTIQKTDNTRVDTENLVRYICGVREMAEALIDILQDEDDSLTFPNE